MGEDDCTSPEQPVGGDAPEVVGSVGVAVEALARAALRSAASSDRGCAGPLLWWVEAHDAPELSGLVVARLTLVDPQVCDPHLEALRGLHAPADAVGAAVAVCADGVFAAHGCDTDPQPVPGVGVALVVLRDGTSAEVAAAEDFDTSALVGVSGRVSVYLRRTLGLASGVEAPDPRMFAARCWLWSRLRRLTEHPDAPAADNGAGRGAATFEGLSPALTLVASLAASGEGWSEILERMRAEAMSPAADPADPCLPGEPYAPMVELLGWMDPDLFAAEMAATVPTFDELCDMWSALGEVPCGFSTVADTALAVVGL